MNIFTDPGVQLLMMESKSLTVWGPFDMGAPYWRFYCNDRKGALVCDGKREISLEPDRCYLIPPETNMIGNLRAKVGHFYIHFTALPPYDRARPGVYEVPADKGILGLIAEERNRASGEDRAHVASGTLRGLTLVHWALLHLPVDSLIARPVDERIERTVAAIQNRPAGACSNVELAALAHMTPNAFIRRFHEIMGESPQHYARRRRIEKACVKLHFSADSIQAIAEETGFCDRYHFSRVFKKVRGMSPARFRKLTV